MNHFQFIIRQTEASLAVIEQRHFSAVYLPVRLRQVHSDLHRRPLLYRGKGHIKNRLCLRAKQGSQ